MRPGLRMFTTREEAERVKEELNDAGMFFSRRIFRQERGDCWIITFQGCALHADGTFRNVWEQERMNADDDTNNITTPENGGR